MKIPTELVPVCPHCGKLLTMNLRSDDQFVEDEGWHKANERYQNFLHKNENQKIVFLELGVGCNTPVIIKYPFWQMTAKNLNTTYACIMRMSPQPTKRMKSLALKLHTSRNFFGICIRCLRSTAISNKSPL